MRKIFYIFLSVFCFYFSAQAEAPQEKITIVADTWCPYNCNPKSPHQGFMVDIAKAAFAKHNIAVEYVVEPWTQAIKDTQKGKYNAVIGASTGDAPDFVFPSITQGFLQNHFYVKKDGEWKYTDIKSLNGVILGVIADYSYNDEMDAYIKKYRLDPEKISIISGDKALGINLSKMLRGKIGATLESKFVMEYYLSQNNMVGQVQEAGALPPSDKDKLYIAFSPKDRKLAEKYAEILSAETKNMRESGELAKILDIYGLADWEK